MGPEAARQNAASALDTADCGARCGGAGMLEERAPPSPAEALHCRAERDGADAKGHRGGAGANGKQRLWLTSSSESLPSEGVSANLPCRLTGRCPSEHGPTGPYEAPKERAP